MACGKSRCLIGLYFERYGGVVATPFVRNCAVIKVQGRKNFPNSSGLFHREVLTTRFNSHSRSGSYCEPFSKHVTNGMIAIETSNDGAVCRMFNTDDTSRSRNEADVGDDAALVEALRSGDGAAFERLVRNYAGRLMAVARRMLPSEDDACDVVQEAFITAFKSIDRFEGKSQLGTWLHRIVVNGSLMKLRGQRRKRERPIEDLLPTFAADGHHSNPGPRWTDSSLASLELEETRAQVRAAIEELPDSYREVLLLRDIEELDTDAVAELLSVSPGAVKVRLHRARQALKTLLDPLFGKSPSDSAHSRRSQSERTESGESP